jgi:hypothetical protein
LVISLEFNVGEDRAADGGAPTVDFQHATMIRLKSHERNTPRSASLAARVLVLYAVQLSRRACDWHFEHVDSLFETMRSPFSITATTISHVGVAQ